MKNIQTFKAEKYKNISPTRDENTNTKNIIPQEKAKVSKSPIRNQTNGVKARKPAADIPTSNSSRANIYQWRRSRSPLNDDEADHQTRWTQNVETYIAQSSTESTHQEPTEPDLEHLLFRSQRTATREDPRSSPYTAMLQSQLMEDHIQACLDHSSFKMLSQERLRHLDQQIDFAKGTKNLRNLQNIEGVNQEVKKLKKAVVQDANQYIVNN